MAGVNGRVSALETRATAMEVMLERRLTAIETTLKSRGDMIEKTADTVQKLHDHMVAGEGASAEKKRLLARGNVMIGLIAAISGAIASAVTMAVNLLRSH